MTDTRLSLVKCGVTQSKLLPDKAFPSHVAHADPPDAQRQRQRPQISGPLTTRYLHIGHVEGSGAELPGGGYSG